MKIVVGARSGWLHLLVWIGLLGLIASFHGIIMGYSRQIFALARAGFLPGILARVHPRWKTPHLAILAGGVVGIAAIYSDKVVTIASRQSGHRALAANDPMLCPSEEP
jgi:ethanolamine permease